MSNHESSGEVPAHVSGQGVQAGTGNTQYNSWAAKQPLDPVALSALNPHTAVARLQQLSHDELADFFARAKTDDVSEIFEVFLEVDEPKAVAILADINRHKATELLSAARVMNDRLIPLPEVAQQIARKAASLKWTDAGPLEPVVWGYTRRYRNGHVFWSSEFGIQTTAGVIDDHYIKSGGLPWGSPAGDQETAQTSPFGTEGIRQKFKLFTVYSSKHGVCRVVNDGSYENEGGSGGWLGFPIGEPERNPGLGDLQNFEGGKIYFYVTGDEFAVAMRREMASALPVDQEWSPISKETAVVSSSGKVGTRQMFAIDHETAVYASDGNGPVMVRPEVWSYYSGLGAEKSWLGFPRSLGQDESAGGFAIQLFEAGGIYWRSGGAPIAVPNWAVSMSAATVGSLGFPVSELQSIGVSESDRIQFYENAVVTLRDGKPQIWLRPADPEPHAAYAVPEHAGGFRPDGRSGPPYAVPEHAGGFRPDGRSESPVG
jgi:uncharacterized protein with LGFP repeats